ncbi:MAG TPA: aminopeptidase [Phycisphaerae bacterium]|nr:aminopeptidase [Phycisphaerae bacterium]
MPLGARIRWSFTAACALWLAGCDGGYFLHLAFGQLSRSVRVMPIADALDDPEISEEEKAKLRLVQEVRLFGIERIGLRETDAYTVFEMNGMEPAAFVISASAKDSLTPFRWDLPFVGAISTKGFFDESLARAEADALIANGYDVFFGRTPGFSTLGFIADPVRQSNLKMDEIELAELILHEMLHTTIFKIGDGNFNEGMATFVGRQAAQTFFEQTYGADSAEAVAARSRFADKKVIDDYVIALYVTMGAYYRAAADRGDASSTIVEGRQAEFDALRARYRDEFEPQLLDPDRWAYNRDALIDNARILAGIVYQGSLDVYESVFVKLNGIFSDTLSVFNEAASQADSLGFLRRFASGSQ